MANLLITGGAGFIGGNFVRYWARLHPDDAIIVLDKLTYAGHESTIAGVEQAELICGDIGDTELVLRLLREHTIDTLVHFAAESHVDRSITGPDAFVETNVAGTHSLLKAARAAWLESGSGLPHRFHHISTDEVFGSLTPDDAGFSEGRPYRPNSPYSATKAASDHLVRAYHQTFGLQVTTSNCSNNYGPYQHPEKLIPRFILNALNGQALPIYGDGMYVRDWLHVEDHCCGIEACITKGRVGECYNIGGGKELSNLAVADALCAEIDSRFATDGELALRYPNAPPVKGLPTSSLQRCVKDRPGHDRRYAIDDCKARSELGYRPAIDFFGGLRATVQWYIQNERWWQAIEQGGNTSI